jgi:hypothetical protein
VIEGKTEVEAEELSFLPPRGLPLPRPLPRPRPRATVVAARTVLSSFEVFEVFNTVWERVWESKSESIMQQATSVFFNGKKRTTYARCNAKGDFFFNIQVLKKSSRGISLTFFFKTFRDVSHSTWYVARCTWHVWC